MGFGLLVRISPRAMINPFLIKVELLCVEPENYSPWVPRNWNPELETRLLTRIPGLDLNIPPFQQVDPFTTIP